MGERVVALLFAVHPLRAEAVAWVGERKSPLSGLFFASTLAAYASYARRPSLARYLAVAGLFTLGLLAKPTWYLSHYCCCCWTTGPWEGGAGKRVAGKRGQRLGDVKPLALVLEKIPLLLLSVACSVTAVLARAGTSRP